VKRIVAKRTLVKFWEKHPESKTYLQTWYETAKTANWSNPNEIREFYSTISILKGSRVVFNIKGNSFRLVAKIEYEKSWLFIRFIGTHEEYDQIDANKI
jgi:mRNA interferase HigB